MVLFSMDGDIAPLDRLYELSKEYNALLMVDDAHATGVIGNGRGTAHHFGLTDVDVQLGTLSKALGSVGGYVAGRKELIEYLINYSRSFIFSTALSPADIGVSSSHSMPIACNLCAIYTVLSRNVSTTDGSSRTIRRASKAAPISAGDKAVENIKLRL